jgi:hypothetical protein
MKTLPRVETKRKMRKKKKAKAKKAGAKDPLLKKMAEMTTAAPKLPTSNFEIRSRRPYRTMLLRPCLANPFQIQMRSSWMTIKCWPWTRSSLRYSRQNLVRKERVKVGG